MKSKKLISVLIPLYNERWCIAPLWGKLDKLRFSDQQYSYDFLFVNDGSTDDSKLVLDELAASDKKVRVIHFSRNFGVTQALLAGFAHAKGDFVVTLDGNLQNEPSDIPAMIEELEKGYDVCVGWRQDAPEGVLKRDLPNRIINQIISSISELELHDFECSMKAYRHAAVENMNLYGDLHKYIPVYAYWRGAKIVEHPVKQHPRATGQGSKDSPIKKGVKNLFDLLLLKFFSRYAQRPLYLFGGVGLASFAFSAITFLFMLYYKLFGDKAFIDTPLPFLAVLGILIGVLLILMGVLAEFVVRIYYLTRGNTMYTVESYRNL